VGRNKTVRADSRRRSAISVRTVARHWRRELISLQKGDGGNQRRDWGDALPDWMDDCGRPDGTQAALVDNLDLVITVDTAIAISRGRWAKPVWLLNRYESEWRWGLERDDSPWYPTMRIPSATRAGGLGHRD